MKSYHVEPFIPSISEKEATAKGSVIVAQQLADLLNRGGRGGWEFEGYHAIAVDVRPGCLGALGGGKTKSIYYRMLVFSRDDQATPPS